MSSSVSKVKGKSAPVEKTKKRKREARDERIEEKEGKEEPRVPRVIVVQGNPGPALPAGCPFVQRNDWHGLVRAYRYTVPANLTGSFASIGAFRTDLATWARRLRLLGHDVGIRVRLSGGEYMQLARMHLEGFVVVAAKTYALKLKSGHAYVRAKGLKLWGEHGGALVRQPAEDRGGRRAGVRAAGGHHGAQQAARDLLARNGEAAAQLVRQAGCSAGRGAGRGGRV